MIKGILLDMGGVLLDLNLEGCIDAFRTVCGFEDIGQFMHTAHHRGFINDLEQGLISPSDFYRECRSHCAPGTTDAQILSSFQVLVQGMKPDTAKYLKELHGRHPLFILSNNNAVILPHNLSLFEKAGVPVPEIFEDCFYSFEFKSVKPSPEFYQEAVRRTGFKAEELLFVDDSVSNVTVARENGIKAVHLPVGKSLREVLEPVLKVQEIRKENPLVHCIANSVADEFNADALLAVGASPIMSSFAEEMVDIQSEAGALVVNIGTPGREQTEAMKIAAAAACSFHKPWVLDPVGAGASGARFKLASMLTEHYHPTIIRGNASEIMTLAGISVPSRGVDSPGQEADVQAAMDLALRTGAVVCVSGPTDIVTDGTRLERVEGGDPIMGRVTGMGCTATALSAAMLCVCTDPFEAAVQAMRLMGAAGEDAARRTSGNGSFKTAFLDFLGYEI